MFDQLFQESLIYLPDFQANVAPSSLICELVESLCLIDGAVLRWPFHLARMQASCQALAWRDVSKELPKHWATASAQMPEDCCQGRTMARIVYGAEGIRSITFRSYAPRLVRSLRLVEANHVDYALKSTNRRAIMECFDQRNGCDDVLMVRDKCFTDTSIANIALWHEQHRRWYTPARPLLRGTHRAFLLRAGTIFEDSALTLDRLSEFSRIRLFNAMLAWGEIELPVVALLPLTAH